MSKRNQLLLLLLHLIIAVSITQFLFLSKIFAVLFFSIGLYVVIKNKNKNNEILYVIAYLSGSEVFIRMTSQDFLYEYGKYSMLFFTLLGFFYSGLSKMKNPYWLYLALLIPSIFISFNSLDGDYRRKIFFEILGPICLGFLSLYNYNRTISLKELNTILTFIGLPILTSCFYLIINYPYNLNQLANCLSNFYYSGGFGPNQLATVLGFGFFIYFFKIFDEFKDKKLFFLNLLLFFIVFYRGLLTFSRGGVITGVIVILCFILSHGSSIIRIRKIVLYTVLITLLSSIFIIVDYQTKNNLSARYANINKNDFSVEKLSRGRFLLVTTDVKNFIENPIFGVGVGVGKEIRKERYKINISTHNELSRLMSEHGLLGVICIVILIVLPLINYKKTHNVYIIPLFIFWFLSVNHSATRIILPLFLYSLTLMKLNVVNEKRHRIE